jgi:tRNA/tmRNA/rRNA uracil-C5-methylase (TrmA/RlmC/RlmD family)
VASLEIPKLIIWGGNYFTDFLPPSPCWLVWDKERPEGLTFADGEVAWTNFSTPLKFIRHRWDGYHRASEREQTRVHPTQKPAFLAEWCFNEYGAKNDKVLDLFGGSGSTLIACEKTNRRCYMMEIDPHYCDVILKRWEQFTGQTAERLAIAALKEIASRQRRE